MTAILEFRDVGFAVPRSNILKNVNFSVESGESVFLSGKSGAGKSTLLKLAAGIQYQTSGDIMIQGVSLKAANNAQLLDLHVQSGYLFQDSALISNMTIFDNLALPLRYHNRGTEYEIRERVEGLLERMDLMEDRNNRPAALSMGEQRVAGLARALIMSPPLIYMDEPLANLDRVRVQLVKTIMRELVAQGTTLVVISHEAEFVREFASRFWLLAAGTIDKDLRFTEDPESKKILSEIM